MVDKIKGGLADSKSLQDIADKHSVSLSAIESALADGIAVEMEHTDDKASATEIAKDHLFEDAEYYTKLKTIEKQNSKDWAKTYKASNFIEKGVCTYNDETIYLSQEALNKAIASIKGRPVVIKHQKVTPQNMEDHAVGYVSDCGFCEQEASFYCNFLVFDDEGKEVIAKDYSVSCAYIPKAFGNGGTWHNTPYDREVTELEFTHLALVPDPRYEDAKIYENSKDEIHNAKTVNVLDVYQYILEHSPEDNQPPTWIKQKLVDSGSKYEERMINLSDLKVKAENRIKNENKEKDAFDIKDIPNIVIDNEYNVLDGRHRTLKALENGIEKLKGFAPIGLITEKQNSTDNTTKETYNMEKIEVEQGFLTSLLALVQQPFLNAKEEVKKEKEEDVKVDDDEMEYEGKKYSKKELVNAFESACAGKKAEEEKEKQNSQEQEEEVVEQPTSDDMEFFNSMQKLMAEAKDPNDKIQVKSNIDAVAAGKQLFG